jgi:SAM-dependent methyltransferase
LREIYRDDLAYIHDAGFSAYCLGVAPGLLNILQRAGIRAGLVVDLGSGGGRWAARLAYAGYDVLGVEQSSAMVKLARAHCPQARFITQSLWQAGLPRCAAVTSVGECLNYGARRPRHVLTALFRRIYKALDAGGLFIFDAASPERIPQGGIARLWSEGDGWAVLVKTAGDARRRSLTRQIVCFRRLPKSDRYRRSEEIHAVALYQPEEILEALADAGFEPSRLDRFGKFLLPEGLVGFVARKPD